MRHLPEAYTLKYLEFIEAAIARMAANSFLLKGWAVTLIAAESTLLANRSEAAFIALAIPLVLVFWGLDSWYLRKERLFRRLYDDVRRNIQRDLPELDLFSMDTSRYVKDAGSWFKTLWRPTVSIFYGSLLILILAQVGIRALLN